MRFFRGYSLFRVFFRVCCRLSSHSIKLVRCVFSRDTLFFRVFFAFSDNVELISPRHAFQKRLKQKGTSKLEFGGFFFLNSGMTDHPHDVMFGKDGVIGVKNGGSSSDAHSPQVSLQQYNQQQTADLPRTRTLRRSRNVWSCGRRVFFGRTSFAGE